MTVSGLDVAASQFNVTDQLIEIVFLLGDLGQHPLAQQGEQTLQIHPLKG